MHSHSTSCSYVKADKALRPLFYMLYTDAFACGEDAGRWLFRERDFKIIKNGRDLDLFAFDPDKRKEMRQDLGIGDCLAIGHVGIFNEAKNQAFVLDVYENIIKTEPDAKLFFIGGVPQGSRIVIRAKAISDNIIFVGATDRVQDYLQAMDGMLLPSLHEGLPLVAVEWQLNGLPCIIADTVTKECCFTDNMEFLALEDSPEIWAEALLNKIRHNNRKQASEKAAVQAKTAGFDIYDAAEKLRWIYVE